MSTALNRTSLPAEPPQAEQQQLWNFYHDPTGFVRENLSPEEISRVVATGEGTLWVDIDARRPEETKFLKTIFNFHPLAREDALNPQSRVKLEEYQSYLLLIVRTVAFCETTEDPYDLDTVNLTLFLGKNYVVSVHGADATPVQTTAALLRRKPELAKFGPARLMHAIVDVAIDAYFPIIDKLDEFMDGLEERVFADFDQDALRDVFAVKRLVLSLRRHLAPQRDAFNILTNRPSSLLTPETQVYFRDIHDHVLRIHESLETYRDLLSSTMDSYLTQVSNRLGTATKALSAVATISLPFVVVSGMWGMNFDHMPLSSHIYGFHILVLSQLLLGLVLLSLLRWRKVL